MKIAIRNGKSTARKTTSSSRNAPRNVSRIATRVRRVGGGGGATGAGPGGDGEAPSPVGEAGSAFMARYDAERRTAGKRPAPDVRSLGAAHAPSPPGPSDCRARDAGGRDVPPGLPSDGRAGRARGSAGRAGRSEEHTSELQSQSNLVCRL